MDKVTTDWVTTGKERIAYTLYFTGQLICYTLVTSFTITYLLNAGLSELLIGSLLLSPKFWDAINDTIFGVMIDKVQLKSGRFLPWIRLSAIVLPLTTVLFFSMPYRQGIGDGLKITWVILGYILWDSAFTIADVPIYALSTSMTSNNNERTSVLSKTRIFGGIGGILTSILVPMLYGENGADAGWFLTALIISGLAVLCLLPICFLGKERYHTERKKNPGIINIWKGLIGNRYLLIFQVIHFLCFLTMTMEFLNSVFSQYVIGNETFSTIISITIGIPIIVVAAFLPIAVRRWDKVYIMAFCIVLFSTLSIIQYLIGFQNHLVVLMLMALKFAGYGGFSTLSYLFIPDCIEYGQYKTGERNEGLSFGIQTFITKLDTALVATTTMFILAALGFNAQHITSQGKDAVWFGVTILTAVGPILALPFLILFYKLRDRWVAIISDYNNGCLSREECKTKLPAAIR